MNGIRTTCPYCGVGCGLVVTPRLPHSAAREASGEHREGRSRQASGDRREGGCHDASDDHREGDCHGAFDDRAAGNSRDDEPAGDWRIAGDADHPANFGRVCSKGAALGETLGLEGRLLHPEVGGRRVDWNEALDAVAGGFTRTIAKHGPDSVAFYVSGQLLTEDYYVANKLMKGFIGSGNIDTNSRLCMASAVAGHKRAFGADIVPNCYEDLECADLLVIVGANMAWCHPVLFQRIVAAKAANPRLRIVVVDPRRTATAAVADVFLPIKPGTDVVLFNGLLSHLRREDALDWEYLDAHVEGFGAALRAAKESSPSIPAVAAACEVPEADVAELYCLFARTERAVTLFSQGVNQSTSGTDKVNSIINAHLASGKIGRPGAGPFSLTGQPNAMGGREVGGLANQLAAHMDFLPEHVDRVARFWDAPRVARQPGRKAVDLFDALEAGEIKAVWIMSTNPVVSMPDANRVAAALKRCDLVVVSDCVRRTDTTAYADVLLPAAAWGEKSGTVTNSERRISRQRAFMKPPGQSRADWWIVTEVAGRMGFGRAFAYRTPADIFREHARLSGFENDGSRAFDIAALADLTDAEYDALAPVQWPLHARGADLPRRLLGGGRFFTDNGKARLVATVPRPPRRTASDEAPFVLNTGRVRDQWHTMTRSGRSPRLSGHHVEPFVQIHTADAARYGLKRGDLVELSNERGRMLARVAPTDDVRPGELFAPMHWNDQYARSARVGALIASAVDPVSGQPELKHAPVRLRRYAAAWYGFTLTRTLPKLPSECDYVARAKGNGYWRCEIAGATIPGSWPEWTRRVLSGGNDCAASSTSTGADSSTPTGADFSTSSGAGWVELQDLKAGRYRAARIVGQRLDACVFVAAEPALPARDWLGGLFAVSVVDERARLGILTGRAMAGTVESGPVVCSCFAVGRGTLVDAIRTRSLVTAADIGRALGAGTNCGSCIPELDALLAEQRAAPA